MAEAKTAPATTEPPAAPAAPPATEPAAPAAPPATEPAAPEATVSPVRLDEFTGSVGKPFAAYGFFPNLGRVSFGGHDALVTAWTERVVRGSVPGDVAVGPIELLIADARFNVTLTD